MANATSNPSFIDVTPYLGPMRFGAQHGIVLAAQLAVAAPSDLPDRPRWFLVDVGAKADAVAVVLKNRARMSVGGLRPLIVGFDNAYGGLHGRLMSASKLPPSVGDIAASATAILEAVLIDGVAFLVNDAETKYAESARRLDVIAERRLQPEIDRVAGLGFLDAVKAAHEALGEAIGVGETPVRFARAELQEAVGDLAQAIADYCIQLAAQVDRNDAASVRRFRAAVMPIDRFRADRAASPGGDASEEPVVTPSPTPTPTPAVGPTPPLTGSPFTDMA